MKNLMKNVQKKKKKKLKSYKCYLLMLVNYNVKLMTINKLNIKGMNNMKKNKILYILRR